MNKKNTYENSDITDNGASEHTSSLHHKCIRTNKYVWDMMKVLEQNEMYGFHFEAKVGKKKILVILYHEEKTALNKAQKVLRKVEKNNEVLFLTKLKAKKKERRLGLAIFISLLVLVLLSVVGSFLYKMGHFNTLLDGFSSTKTVHSSVEIEEETQVEPVIEEIVVDIQKLERLKESFEEQNNSNVSPEVLHALTLTTGIISDMVSDEAKAQYSSEALVESFEVRNGFQLVVKDDGSHKDFNATVQELNAYAMKFIKENNLSKALQYYDKVATEANLSNEVALITAQHKGELFERMGLPQEAKNSYEKALSLGQLSEESNLSFEALSVLEEYNVSELLHHNDVTLNHAKQNQQTLEHLMANPLFKENSQTLMSLYELQNLGNLSDIYEDLNQTQQAQKIRHKTENLYKLLILELAKYGEIKSEELALTLKHLAHFYERQKAYLLAIEIHKEAVKIYDILSQSSFDRFALLYYQSLNALANAQFKLFQLQVAKKNYHKALEILQKPNQTPSPKHQSYLALSYRALAGVAIQEGLYKDAKTYYDKALAIYQTFAKDKKTHAFEEIDMYGEFARLYALEKNFRLAKQAYHKGIYNFMEMNEQEPLKYCLKIAKLLNDSAKMKVTHYDSNSTEVTESKMELRESIQWAKKGMKNNFAEAKEIMIESYAYLAYITGKNNNMRLAKRYYQHYQELKNLQSIKGFNTLE